MKREKQAGARRALQLYLGREKNSKPSHVRSIEVSKAMHKVHSQESKNVFYPIACFNVRCSCEVSCIKGALTIRGAQRDKVPVALAHISKNNVCCCHHTPL